MITTKNYYQITICVGIFLLITMIYLTSFPIMLVLLMILISIIPFLGSIPQSWTLSIYSRQMLNALINLLIVFKLYYLLSYFYFILNCKLTLKGFKVFTIFSGLLFLLYLVCARYILYLKLESMPIPYWLYILFFLSSFSLVLRSITTLTLFVMPYIMYVYPHKEQILQMGPEMPSEMPPMPPSTPVVPPVEKRFGGFYNKHTHYHHYPNIPPEIPRSLFHRNFGYGIACAGVCLSVFACAQYYKSANAAVVAANAAVISANEAQRAADVAAQQANLISVEEFYKRHPKDRPPKPPTK